MQRSLMKQPSAIVPIAMSLAALAVVLSHLTLSGTAREADEGTAAHVWQLLMGGQLPIEAYFALRWVPHAPAAALRVLAVQALAGLAACAPVYYFDL